jgi:hypothetical protein
MTTSEFLSELDDRWPGGGSKKIERDHFGLPPTNIEIPAGVASE